MIYSLDTEDPVQSSILYHSPVLGTCRPGTNLTKHCLLLFCHNRGMDIHLSLPFFSPLSGSSLYLT